MSNRSLLTSNCFCLSEDHFQEKYGF